MNFDGWAWVVLGATALGAWTSTIFHSLRDVSRARIEELLASRADGPSRHRVQRVVNESDAHAAVIALPRIICSFVAAVGAVFWVARLRASLAPGWTDIAIGIAIGALLTWIFGLAIPTAIAKHASAEVVFSHARLLRAAHAAFVPLTLTIRFFDEVVRRLAGRPRSEAGALQQELLSVVEEARQGGEVDQTEHDMIESIVRFRHTTVAQIMTPRTEMEAMPFTNNLGEITATIRRTRHSRVPVYQASPDNIVGIFYVKDLMRWLAGDGAKSGKTFEFRSILRPAIFVPETKTIRELLQELLDKKVHIVMVADEFGGTAGLVTIEDILEEIVGDIRDEYEPPEEDVPEVRIAADRSSADVDARAYIETVNDALLPVGIEIPESDDYDTVGGYVTVTLGRIPAKGERARLAGIEVTVLEAEPTRITRVRLAALDVGPEDGAAGAIGRSTTDGANDS